jgi:hypothetical protein
VTLGGDVEALRDLPAVRRADLVVVHAPNATPTCCPTRPR